MHPSASAPSHHDHSPVVPAVQGRTSRALSRSIGARRDGSAPAPVLPTGATPPDASEDSPDGAPASPLERLIAVGVASAKARTLVAAYAPARIERQLAWLDSRRCQNRVGTLITAIERDYGPPPAYHPDSGDAGAFDPAKFYRGTYAVCPECGCRPCVQGCEGGPL